MRSNEAMFIFRNTEDALVYIFVPDKEVEEYLQHPSLVEFIKSFNEYYNKNEARFIFPTQIAQIDWARRYGFASRYRTYERISDFHPTLIPIKKEEVLDIYRRVKIYPHLRDLAESLVDMIESSEEQRIGDGGMFMWSPER